MNKCVSGCVGGYAINHSKKVLYSPVSAHVAWNWISPSSFNIFLAENFNLGISHRLEDFL